MPSQRSGFASYAFHEIAARAHGVDVEVKNFETGPVEIRGQPFTRNGHSKAVSDALAEWAGSGLYAGCNVRFRMPRGAASELPEALDFLHGDRQFSQHLTVFGDFPNACKIKHGVEQHGGMAIGEYESITVQPLRILRIVAQKLLPQAIGNGRQAHGGQRLAAVSLLHRIDRHGANRVDT